MHKNSIQSNMVKKRLFSATAMLMALVLLLASTFVSGWFGEEDAAEAYSTDDYNDLIAAGFPASYAKPLAILKETYPNWEFEPQIVGLDWTASVEAECVAGENYVSINTYDGYKSTDTWAYSWETNTWYTFDTGKWNGANPAVVAYYMDPRNFLNETAIFQFATLKYDASQNLAGINAILSGTFMAGNLMYDSSQTYAQVFESVGKKYGMNPYFLASKARIEMGVNGTTACATGILTETNTVDPSKTVSFNKNAFNYFNIKAYNHYDGWSALAWGLMYAQSEGWTTIPLAIDGGAAWINSRYIGVGQDTYYTQKYNVTNPATSTGGLYKHQYATDVEYAYSQGITFAKAYANKNQKIVFTIPVYENMPATACALPSTANPNNYLATLSISGASLTPGFKGKTREYSTIVDSKTESITVSATAVASTSSVSGTGTYSLGYGYNTISVVCTAENGKKRTYTVTVYRDVPEKVTYTFGENDTSSITSPYLIDTEVTRLSENTMASDMIRNISTTACSVRLTDADGAEVTGRVATGQTMAILDSSGNVLASYPILIYGDINGDGRISNGDVVKIMQRIINRQEMTELAQKAADVNRDGKISNQDIVKMLRQILKLESIHQGL